MPGPSPVRSFFRKQRKLGVYWYCILLAFPIILLIAAAFGLLVNGLHRMDTAALLISEKYLPDYQARHPLQRRVEALRRAVLSVRLSDNMDLCRRALADARLQLDKTFVDRTLSSADTDELRRFLDDLESAKLTASREKADFICISSRLARRTNRLSAVSGRMFAAPEIPAASPYSELDLGSAEARFRESLRGFQEPLELCKTSPALKGTHLCREVAAGLNLLEEAWQRQHQAQIVVYNLSSAIDFRLRDWFSRFEAANNQAIRDAVETMDVEHCHLELVVIISIVVISIAGILCFLIFLHKVIRPISLASQQLRRLEASGDCETPPPSRIRELDDLVGMLPRLRELIAGMKAHSLNLAEECSEFRQMSFMDELSGVPNRRSLDAALAAMEPRCALGVLLLDVDNFKAYNDTFGHQMGDEALRMVAQAGAAALGDKGAFYRYGGEEFCALISGEQARDAARLAEEIRLGVRALQIPHPGNPPGVLTVSIGVAVRDEGDYCSNETLLRQADTHLYRAKTDGRDCVRARIPLG